MDDLRTALDLPARPAKPRTTGFTHVIDTGLSARQAEDLVDVAGDAIDLLKLGWGTSVVSGGLERKVAVYRDAGIDVTCGGTLFEAAYEAGALDALLGELDRLGITHLEVSDGSIDLPHERKLELVAQLAQRFTVFSEVGYKDDREVGDHEWVPLLQSELDAGATKVVTEARESGTTGLFAKDGSTRDTTIDTIVRGIGLERVLFEAPQKSQQVWFLRQYGPLVNLGNIATSDVVSLETLRLGLRGDTLTMARDWPRGARA
jgi:phosphosulfolactate synthase